MSWLYNLFETYQSNLDRVGVIEKNQYEKEFTLLPVSHTTQNAHIEVAVTEEGEFHSAFVIDKGNANTLVPCTEDAGNKVSSTKVPYPLHSKLSYAAGDFVDYGKDLSEEPFFYYINQLEEWVNKPFATAKIKSIYSYLKKRRLIKDLVEVGILFVNGNDHLITKWDKTAEEILCQKPEIFSVVTGGLESLFIRFNVYSSEKTLTKVWKDTEIYDSYIQFYKDFLSSEDYCYVTGNLMPLATKHVSKIRNSGDKAKLISANDSNGFTYRGRFSNSQEVACISYDVSQKAHNALKWLINRQAKIVDQRVFLVWGNTELSIPAPVEDSYDIVFSLVDDLPSDKKEIKTYIHEDFANQVSRAIDGYKNRLSANVDVNIMVLDSATTGRLAVLYYRNMDKDLYLLGLKNWHSTCVWTHRYRKDDEGRIVTFYGAPSTKDIAFAAYGPKVNEKVVKGLMERMLPCIVDGQKIPFDIVRSAIQQASNPVSLERWEWEKTLSITCALINKLEEEYNVALDKENIDRSYLFGRLLAIADVLERNALDSKETRATNAIRYMNSFSMHPERTWKTIQAALQPYQARLGTRARYLSGMIDEVAIKFDLEDFNNKPLSGKYLLGFYSQRHELYQKKEVTPVQETTNEEGGSKE